MAVFFIRVLRFSPSGSLHQCSTHLAVALSRKNRRSVGTFQKSGSTTQKSNFKFFVSKGLTKKHQRRSLKNCVETCECVSQATYMMLGELLHFGAYSLTCAFIHLLHIQVTLKSSPVYGLFVIFLRPTEQLQSTLN